MLSLPSLCSFRHAFPPPPNSPEPLSLMVKGSWVSAIGGLVQLRQQGLAGFLTGVVGELDGDGLGGAGWLLSVQALDGLLCLYPLIKADEAHTSGAACGASRSQTNTGPFTSQGFHRTDAVRTFVKHVGHMHSFHLNGPILYKFSHSHFSFWTQ